MKKKLVKESLNENIRYQGHTYTAVKIHNDTIYVGKEGILGDNEVLIPWELIEELMNQYYSH